MPIFFIIFLVIPFIEIAVFIAVGEHIGLFTTLLLAFLTAIIGGAIIRYQGLGTFSSLRMTMERGEMPVKELFEGFCLVAAGALLITPGFVTDTAGFLLLVPQVREALRDFLMRHGTWTVYGEKTRNPDIIEVEYTDITPPDEK